MKTSIWITFAALLPLPVLASTPGQDAQPKAESKAASKAVETEPQGAIEGTWRMVSYRYGGKSAPLLKVEAGRVMLKHITPGRFAWVDYVVKTKKVSRMAGGTFTLQGGAYRETVEYGSGEDIAALLGKGQVFQDTITGQRWHHKGKLSTGFEIEENWERVQ